MNDSVPPPPPAGDDKNHHQKWFPLESNPTLMNQYIATLGWDVTQYHMVDVFSTEDWALDMIPQPVLAVVLLYPLTKVQLQYEQQEKEQILQMKSNTHTTSENDVWFIKQRIGNACGTIGLLHSMMNAVQQQQQSSENTTASLPLIQPNSWLDTFWNSTRNMKDPIQRAERLECDTEIATFHDQATSSSDNQTSRGNTVDDDIITHFITFVSGTTCNNTTTTTGTEASQSLLYELDGRKVQPICHGTTASTNATLLQDACTIIQEQFMARDPNELRFTIMALAPNTTNDDDENE
jgi:ubiquitin carboxyl-terminal hydrolase L3